MPCVGTASGELCGGNDKITAYKIQDAVSEYRGCYADTKHARAMDAEGKLVSEDMTNEVRARAMIEVEMFSSHIFSRIAGVLNWGPLYPNIFYLVLRRPRKRSKYALPFLPPSIWPSRESLHDALPLSVKLVSFAKRNKRLCGGVSCRDARNRTGFQLGRKTVSFPAAETVDTKHEPFTNNLISLIPDCSSGCNRIFSQNQQKIDVHSSSSKKYFFLNYH